MTWVILAGLDRSGKTTVAEYYKSQGYHYIHMSAPNKKYYESGYTGPSYLDEILELLMKYDNHDVVWDRSWYGEKVWPEVYGREPLLNEEDYEVIHEYEYRNDTVKYLLHDHNIAAHWERIQNDTGLKPSSKEQFITAGRSHMKLLANDNFQKKTMHDFPTVTIQESTKNTKSEIIDNNQLPIESHIQLVANDNKDTSNKSIGQTKLEQANAINSILNSNIIKKKGDVYDALECDIRNFLQKKLSILLGEPQEDFSTNEIQILKQFCVQVQSKLNRGT